MRSRLRQRRQAAGGALAPVLEAWTRIEALSTQKNKPQPKAMVKLLRFFSPGGGASWPIMTSCVPFLFALALRALAQCETPRLAQGGLTGVGWEDTIATAERPRHVSL